MSFEKLANLLFCHDTLSRIHDQFFKLFFWCNHLEPIDLEKRRGNQRCYSFVSIMDWMISDQMKQLGSSRLVNLLMKKILSESGFWLSERGHEQALVP